MEVDFPRYGEGLELARVVKCLQDKDGIPIGTANAIPILDTRIYEVEYPDGYQASLAANTIAATLFAQIDDEGHHSVLLQEIFDHRVNGREVIKEHALIISHNGGKRRNGKTQG